jgi:hypothetical protein
MNEREETSGRALVVQHLVESDLIVNTAQMRDAASLDAFRWIPSALVSADIIKAAAKQTHSEREKKKKIVAYLATATSGATENSAENSDPEEPAKKRTRGLQTPNFSGGVAQSSISRPTQQTSSSLHRIVDAPNDTGGVTIPPTQFTFSNTFQSSFQN